jgi:hypothetical protein
MNKEGDYDPQILQIGTDFLIRGDGGGASLNEQ